LGANKINPLTTSVVRAVVFKEEGRDGNRRGQELKEEGRDGNRGQELGEGWEAINWPALLSTLWGEAEGVSVKLLFTVYVRLMQPPSFCFIYIYIILLMLQPV
jgi:hypothetical protein